MNMEIIAIAALILIVAFGVYKVAREKRSTTKYERSGRRGYDNNTAPGDKQKVK